MPNYPFVPIIGSGFDSIGQQQRSWAGFNADIESQNLARAEEAQRNQNAMIMRAQAAQQQQADRISAVMAAENVRAEQQRRDDLAQQNWMREFQLRQQEGVQRGRLEAERTKAMTVRDTLSQQAMEAQRRDADIALANAGVYYSGEYPKARKAYQDSQNQIDEWQQSKEMLDGELAEIKGKTKPTPEDVTRIQFLRRASQLMDQKIKGARKDHTALKAHFDKLETRMNTAGFELNDDSTGIVHPGTGKTFDFKAMVGSALRALPIAAPLITPRVPTSPNAALTTAPEDSTTPTTGFSLTPPTTGIIPSAPVPGYTKVWVRGPDGRLVLQTQPQ